MLHWILFGIVAIAGIFLVMRIDLSSQLGVRGAWQVSFLQAVQESEKDLLFIDQTARSIAESSSQEIYVDAFKDEFGCGMYQEVSLWNNKNGFCPLKLDERLAEKIKETVFERTSVHYEQIVIKGGELVGKAKQKKSQKVFGQRNLKKLNLCQNGDRK